MRYDKAFCDRGYHTALLTTFSFDPTVFENVPLVALRSRGCRNIGILAEQDMVNRTLSELAPAPRAGTAYHLAKVKVAGAFHPKIVLQFGNREGKLMVGSANLTGAGLVGNLETVSIISMSEDDRAAAPLLARALAYFERHVDKGDRAMREVITRARAKTPWLAEFTPQKEVEINGQRVAFLFEEEDAGIGESFRDFVGDDQIDRLVVVSPYADRTLEGFSRLREAFGNPPTAFVVDPHEQDFTAKTFAGQAGASLHSSEPHRWGKKRHLHAKLIVACGRRADYVLAGSANVSVPGFYSRFGGPGNAEAVIGRTEPAGTSIDRLDLSDCLATPYPLSEITFRKRGQTHAGSGFETPQDGGIFWVEYGFLYWRPPAGIDPLDCLLQLSNGAGANMTAKPRAPHGENWTIDIGVDAGTLRSAIVTFADGRKSAPVPVASLTSLQRNASPVRSGLAGRILAELEDRDHIDPDDYDRAMKLMALLRSDATRKQDVTRKNADVTEEDEGQILPEEEFGRIAKTPEGREGLKTGPISEMRRLVNSFLGLQFDVSGDDDVLDPLAQHIKYGTKPDNEHSDQDKDNDDKDNVTNVTPPIRNAQPVRSMTLANDRADKLVGHVEQTCHALAAPDIDPLNLEIAIRLHLLINIFLSYCAPVGVRPAIEHPISAKDLPRSWIRILGRLLIALDEPMARSSKRIATNGLDEECVEALTTILFCARLMPDAARETVMLPAVIDKLEAVKNRLARSAGLILAGNPAAEEWVGRKLTSLTASHCLMPRDTAQPPATSVAARAQD